MAKKQILNYKFSPGVELPDTNQYPNTYALLDANKKFIQEETIAFIQYGVTNNIPPFIYYTYNADKCRRDVSYVLEGYISDLRKGGNWQTVNNASKYFENGIPQIDGSREPEIAAHTFIDGLVQNYILENIAFTPKQFTVSQVVDLAYNAEAGGKTKLSTLNAIIVNVITNGRIALPTATTNRGIIKFPGYFKLKDILLITNTTRNSILYNFAEPTLAADLTYSENFDSDFPGALFGNEKVTTIVLDADTSNMMVTDAIQIFVESKEQAVRLNSIATDAMERQKVGIPQSMLDADFEYGLQPTKWQAIGLMRNYPSVYEIPGSDLPVTSVVTDASSGTASAGASLLTVTCVVAHGLSVGSPFTIKALANSVSGFSRAEGSFLVAGVTSPNVFTFYAKSKVGTTNGEVLSSTYTQLRKAGYYTGAAVGNPSFSVYSAGSSGTITTQLITSLGADTIGFTGTAPPLGSPLAGTGVVSGSQVTAVTGSGGIAATTTLTVNGEIGDTSIQVDNLTGIGPGLVLDRGDGVSVAVTDIVGNVVSLSGALTSLYLGNTQTYANVNQTSTTGTGTGAVFSVTRSSGSYVTTVTNPGNRYSTNDTISIVGTNLGGTAPTNDATITVTLASDKDTVSALDLTTLTGGSGYSNSTGVSTTVSPSGGTGLTLDLTLNSGSVTSATINTPGRNYAVGNVISVGGNVVGRVLTTNTFVRGTGYTNGNDIPCTGGSGSGLSVDINCNDNAGLVIGFNVTAAGTGYSDGAATTTALTGTGTGFAVAITTSGGVVISATLSNPGTGYVVGNTVRIDGGGANAEITITNATNGQVQNYTIRNLGQNYLVNDIVTILGPNNNATFTIASVTSAATVEVLTVSPGGVIQSVSTAGTAISVASRDFISAFTINTPTTAQIASGNTSLTYSSIATIQVDFTTAHGFVPGNTITVQINSTGTNAQYAAGAYFVEQVPTSTSLRYVARASGTIANTLSGVIYARPDSYFLHRPFDGGVQLGTGGAAHGASAIRMSKKYIRYQSGKGVMYNTGALFAPSYDILSITATGTSIGSVITIRTDDTDHGCQVGAEVTISGVSSFGFNGVYTVSDVLDERQFSVIAYQVLGATNAVLDSPCQMTIRKWHGATVRAGIFDEQNGMFYQYDGQRLAVVKRSSTFQIAGIVAIDANSNLMTGTNTRFSQQLASGDKIVIRGMTHIVTEIISDTSMTVAPDYRGVNNATSVKICKTIDLIVPQENWNLDACNGSGPSGYNIDIGKMQMIGIQHTWYGAGFIDFMLRGPEGNYVFVHRFRNSNFNSEAYMRTGNQPVRYEVINEGARTRLLSSIDASQTVIPLENAYYFPSSGTVLIDAEMVRFTGNSGTSLTGCTRGATLTQFVAGSQRTFSGGVSASHTAGNGVVLISNTISPIISHWGSAFMIDGQFDSDRGYIFNYAATGFTASVDKVTAFLIRLAPSVSNAQIGDLGERELLNRAQLLLSSLAISSDGTTGGATPAAVTGAIVVEGVLNPSNYPEDPTKITWTGLSSQAAGGQPSFAQIASGGSVTWGGNVTTSTATVQGAFTTTLTATSFAPVTTTLTATSFTAITRTAAATSFSSAVSPTYSSALSTARTDFLIPTSTYDAFTTPLLVGDSVFQSPYINPARTINTITRNYITLNSISYTRIIMSAAATATSPGGAGQNQTVTFTSAISQAYGSALSTARTDFLIPQSQASSTTATTTDVLSATTFIIGSQTISSITQNYVTLSGVAYARVIMSSAANVSSTGGSGNNVTITVTSAATARYGAALSTARTDFLITNAQAASAGILAGDTLSIGTYITSGQTISTITTSYITIGATTYTRIVMSAVANASSPSGAGQNQTVTVTASGSAATYNGTNYLFFTSSSWTASGAVISTKVSSDQTQFPAGTTVTGVSTRTFGATTVYRVTFTQSSNTSIAAASTLKFAFGAFYALPGEQVFSFIANPGETNSLDLSELKELTATALGGRGTFPNGPDVLAINVFKVSGVATPANVILRWGEAQA
jgi:hypothetical protein